MQPAGADRTAGMRSDRAGLSASIPPWPVMAATPPLDGGGPVRPGVGRWRRTPRRRAAVRASGECGGRHRRPDRARRGRVPRCVDAWPQRGCASPGHGSVLRSGARFGTGRGAWLVGTHVPCGVGPTGDAAETRIQSSAVSRATHAGHNGTSTTTVCSAIVTVARPLARPLQIAHRSGVPFDRRDIGLAPSCYPRWASVTVPR